MKVERIVNDLFDENTYLLFNKESVIVIDPGSNYNEIKKAIDDAHIKHVYLYLTHAHYDHITSAKKLQETYQAPILMHQDELALAQDPKLNLSHNYDEDIILENVQPFKDKVKIPGYDLSVYHVPGHTQGHSMLRVDEVNGLFTGDFIFKGDIGRTDLPTGDFKTMKKSLKVLQDLDPELVIYPGHYDSSTIAAELAHNPYLKELDYE
jgi:hydroxyacylglutathione hydrolase